MDKNTVVALLGASQDRAPKKTRWERWRPSVALCMHADWPVDSLVLIHLEEERKLSKRILKDIKKVSPDTRLIRWPLSPTRPDGSGSIADALRRLSEKIRPAWIHGSSGHASIQALLLSRLLGAGQARGMALSYPPTDPAADSAGRLELVPFEKPALAPACASPSEPLLPTELDEFDRVQLAGVLAICRQSESLSAAGRRLFALSRAQKARPNDADRLRKYLARFGLRFQDLSSS